uniref:BTB domain-containing protein n=1 Tax=Timema shepardi TaxID=629360 RepID=A0A7R9AMQ6_TIMSH|nr:unnamed protein product [Timema shepardi]
MHDPTTAPITRGAAVAQASRSSIHTHRSILEARAAKFFSKLCSIPGLVTLPDGLISIRLAKTSEEYVRTFIGSLYTRCSVADQELEAIKHLERLSEHTGVVSEGHSNVDSVITPDSDVYLTPYSSPSEAHHQFDLDNTTQFDLDNTTRHFSSATLNLRTTNRSYYSIVALDEDCEEETPANVSKTQKPYSNHILEKELAEQDELFKSFQLIKSKEDKQDTKKIKKPTFLPLISSHQAKTHQYVCDKSYKRSKELKKIVPCTRAQIPSTVKGCSSVVSEKFWSDARTAPIKKNSEYKSYTKQAESKETKDICDCIVDINDNSFCNEFSPYDTFSATLAKTMECDQDDCLSRTLATEDPLNLPCSPEMDASAGGPDSGLDTSSTGFMPGGDFSSPREHTASETSGVDLTEATVGEEIPLDGETGPPKSSSSSVSSEVGTWDNVYLTSWCHDTEAFLYAERKLADDLLYTREGPSCVPCLHPQDDTWCEVEDGIMSLNIPTNCVEHYCHKVLLKPSEEAIINPSLESEELTKMSLPGKDDSSPRVKSSIAVSLSYPEVRTDWAIENGSHFFINAADLMDESEVSLPYTCSVSNEQPTSITSEPSGGDLLLPHKQVLSNKQPQNLDSKPSGILKEFVAERPKCDLVKRGLPDYPMLKSNFTVQDTLPTGSPLEAFSGDFIPFLSSEPPIDNIKDQFNTSESDAFRSYLSGGEHVSESQLFRPTPLQVSNSKLEQKVSALDHTAEFEKEIKLVEHLEPLIEIKKSTTSRKALTSSSGDDLGLNKEANKYFSECVPELCQINKQENGDVKRIGLVNVNKRLPDISYDSSKENINCLSDCNTVKTFKSSDIAAMKLSKIDNFVVDRHTNDLISEPQGIHDSSCPQNEDSIKDNTSCYPIEHLESAVTNNLVFPCNENITDQKQEINNCKDDELAKAHSDCEEMAECGRLVKEIEPRLNTEEEQDEIPRRASLIRRNTFELDPDDDRLALLRQDYERRQGNLLFQSCIPQFSGHVTDIEGFHETTSDDLQSSDGLQIQSLPCLPFSDTVLLTQNEHPPSLPVKSPHLPPHIVSHDLNTPDSLNNDSPLEGFLITHSKFECPHSNIMSDTNIGLEQHRKDSNGAEIVINKNIPCEEGPGGCNKSLERNIYSLTSTYDNSSKPVVSGALTCSDVVLDEKQSTDSPKKQKRTESTPIVSGGALAIDFTISSRGKVASPILSRRKNESAPILSGAAVVVVEPEPKVKETSSANAAWVVDMSDCSPSASKTSFDFKKRRKSEVNHEKIITPSKNEGRSSGLGFFVDLKKSPSDHCLPKEISKTSHIENSIKCDDLFVCSNEINKVSFEHDRLFISEEEIHKSKSPVDESYKSDTSPKDSANKSSAKKEYGLVEKKNAMFSMFIDIGAPTTGRDKLFLPKDKHSTIKKSSETNTVAKEKSISSKTVAAENNSPLSPRQDFDKSVANKINRVNNTTFDADDCPALESQKGTYMFIESGQLSSSQNSTPLKSSLQDVAKEVKEEREKRQGFFMYIENESPVPRRKTLPSGQRPSVHRHSWNADVVGEKVLEEPRSLQVKLHKRAHSLSVDRSTVFGSPDDSKPPPMMKNKIRRSSQSLHESLPPPGDHIQTSHGKLSNKNQARLTKQARSLEADESARSNSDRSLHAKQISGSSTELEDLTQHDNGHSISASHSFLPEDDRSASCTEMSEDQFGDESKSKKDNDTSSTTMTDSEYRNKPVPEVEVNGFNKKDKSSIEKEDQEKPISGSFVKLSDLNTKPSKEKNEISDDVLPSFASTNRMSRSIPETSWIESKLMMTRSIGGGTSSCSMNRLFPHLHTNTSSPPITSRNKSPEGEDIDAQTSETSDLSSMQSSMGPSGLDGSTEETDASSSYMGRSGPVSRLGEDLLRMFLEEINPDVTVEVGGRRLKAHKCILSSRCQYFAAMLSGGWVESAGNVISLQGFSYNAVHFALCHIYSGTSNIPDTISIVELATLADMLGLEGLKEPCTMCAVGVVECLPLAAAYGLDDIYRKSLRWITKYFVRIWPTKGFASLPRELVEKCYQQHVVHMTVDNVLGTIMNCDKLLATLPSVRWAEPIFGIASQLLEAAIKFVGTNFCGVLKSESFQALGKELSWNISRLEDSLMAATDRLPPDQACQSHTHLYNLLSSPQSVESLAHKQWSMSFCEVLRRLQKRVEASLVKQAARAARCPSWSHMNLELRKKVQEAACLVLVPGEEAQRFRQSTLSKRSGDGSHHPTSRSSRSLDIRQVKLAMTQQARRVASNGRVSILQADTRTRAQSATGHRKQKSEPPALLKPVPKVDSEETVVRPKTWPLRVMESKARPVKQQPTAPGSSTSCVLEKTGSIVKRSGKTLISSSDSSRTSSPAMRRAGSALSQTPNSRDLKVQRKHVEDPLPELVGTGVGRRVTREHGDSLTSKSCISTRPDTPSVTRKVRNETTMSTDSLSEPATSYSERIQTSLSAPSHSSVNTRPDTPPVKGRMLGRLGVEGTMSSDSLANTDSSLPGETSSSEKRGSSPRSPKVNKVLGKVVDGQQRSPSMRRVAIRQSVVSPRDSPTARLCSDTATIGARRSLTTSTKSPSDISTKTCTVKPTLSPSVKRTPTRLQTRNMTAASPAKPIIDSPKSSGRYSNVPAKVATRHVVKTLTTTSGKGGSSVTGKKAGTSSGSMVNGNRICDKTAPSKSCVQDDKPPTVGSRSGTFLKDEPTVIKIPNVAEVIE